MWHKTPRNTQRRRGGGGHADFDMLEKTVATSEYVQRTRHGTVDTAGDRRRVLTQKHQIVDVRTNCIISSARYGRTHPSLSCTYTHTLTRKVFDLAVCTKIRKRGTRNCKRGLHRNAQFSYCTRWPPVQCLGVHAEGFAVRPLVRVRTNVRLLCQN